MRDLSRNLDFRVDWEKLQHYYSAKPEAEAFWVGDEVILRVRLRGKHWFKGTAEPPHKIDLGMAYKIHPRDMWSGKEDFQIPIKTCSSDSCRIIISRLMLRDAITSWLIAKYKFGNPYFAAFCELISIAKECIEKHKRRAL